MNPLFTFIVIGIIGYILWFTGERLASSGMPRWAEAFRACGVVVVLFAIHIWHAEDNKSAAEKLAATFIILEERVQRGDRFAALEIADRGVRYFSGEPSRLSGSAEALRSFASSISKRPNKSAEPTPAAGASPAARETSQP